MNRLFSKSTLWVTATFCWTVIAFSAGQNVPPPAPLGERILNRTCTECHDLRRVETSAHDQEGWTKVVRSMMEKGAAVNTEDVPALVSYLTQNHGPLPEGEGKAIMLNVCTQCHTLDRIRGRAADRAEWEELLLHMLNEGAPLEEEDFPVLLGYLSRNFTH